MSQTCFIVYVVDSSYREGDIRLVRGSYNWEGRVEIFLSERWSTIYDTSWTYADAQVVCRQLGHSTEGTDSFDDDQFTLMQFQASP